MRSMRTFPAALAASVMLCGVAHAQLPSPDGTQAAPCRFDTAAATRNVPVTIGLVPGFRHRSSSAPDDYAFAAQSIRAHFAAPASLALPLWARTSLLEHNPSVPPDVLGYGLHGELVFRLTPAGRLADTLVSINTASTALNAALVAAVRSADSAMEFAPPSDEVLGDSGTIVLRLVDWGHHTGPGVPLMRVDMPTLQVNTPAKVILHAKPQYPDVALEQQIPDTVVLLYVVREDGQVDPGTFRVVAGKFREFAVSAMLALAQSRFMAAQIGECSVPQEVLGWVAFYTHE
jgi:hypothetical protein